MSNAYRDPLAARIAALADAAAATTFEELTALDRELDAGEGTLRRALAALEETMAELDVPPPQPAPSPHRTVPRDADGIAHTLESVLPDVEPYRECPSSGRGLLRTPRAGTLAVVVDAFLDGDVVLGFDVNARAALPDLGGAFAFDPAGSVRRYRARLGMGRPRSFVQRLLGAPEPHPPRLALADRFVVTGDQRLAQLLVGRDAYATLCAIDDLTELQPPSGQSFPSLHVEPGFGEVSYAPPWNGRGEDLRLDLPAAPFGAMLAPLRQA